MGRLFEIVKVFFEGFYLNDPFGFSISKEKLFFLFILIVLGGLYIYFRSQNIDEMELLKKKHTQMQLAVKGYLHDMSSVTYSDCQQKEKSKRIEQYKRQIKSIEEEINSIKKFWLIE